MTRVTVVNDGGIWRAKRLATARLEKRGQRLEGPSFEPGSLKAVRRSLRADALWHPHVPRFSPRQTSIVAGESAAISLVQARRPSAYHSARRSLIGSGGTGWYAAHPRTKITPATGRHAAFHTEHPDLLIVPAFPETVHRRGGLAALLSPTLSDNLTRNRI